MAILSFRVDNLVVVCDAAAIPSLPIYQFCVLQYYVRGLQRVGGEIDCDNFARGFGVFGDVCDRVAH